MKIHVRQLQSALRMLRSQHYKSVTMYFTDKAGNLVAISQPITYGAIAVPTSRIDSRTGRPHYTTKECFRWASWSGEHDADYTSSVVPTWDRKATNIPKVCHRLAYNARIMAGKMVGVTDVEFLP